MVVGTGSDPIAPCAAGALPVGSPRSIRSPDQRLLLEPPLLLRTRPYISRRLAGSASPDLKSAARGAAQHSPCTNRARRIDHTRAYGHLQLDRFNDVARPSLQF